MPSIERLSASYRARGLEVLLMNLGEDPERVRQTAKARGYGARVVLDPEGIAGRAYAVRGTPTVFLITRAGSIAGRAIGRRDWDSSAAQRLLDALVGTAP